MQILFLNIVVGQVVEVGTLLIGKLTKSLVSCFRVATRSRSRTAPEDGGDDGESGAPIDLQEVVAKRKSGIKLTVAEEKVYAGAKVMIDLLTEYERVPVKTVKQGLGSTFYEYNELAIQYGYLVMFSVALPLAPLLALVNNLIEFRSDALKLVYIARRIPTSRAMGIGPWAGALRALSYLGLACNLSYLALTTDFFSRLAVRWPDFERTWVRISTIVIAEHLLLLVKLTVDFLLPDVPDRIRARLARTEFLAGVSVLKSSAPQLPTSANAQWSKLRAAGRAKAALNRS